MKKLMKPGLLLLAIVTTSAHAASTTLGTVVEQAGGTALQVGTGDAVQQTCGAMASGGFATVIPENRPATSPEEDLFFRCNELVMTANGLVQNGPPPGQGSALNSLGWTSSELAEAMQQLTGEEQASKSRLATETSNGQFGNVAMRLDAIRQGARSTAGGINLAMQGVPVVGGSAGEGGDRGGWGWFANGAIGFGDRDASNREDEYDFDSLGATLGVDYQLRSGAVFGAAVGYNDFEIDFKDQPSSSGSTLTSPVAGGGIDLDGWAITGYGIGDIGGMNVDAVISYGENDYDSARVVRYLGSASGGNRGQNLNIDRVVRGKTEGKTLSVGVSGSSDFQFGDRNTLFLVVGLNYLEVNIDDYTEVDPAPNGGLNLRYGKQDIKSVQSRLGLQLTRPFSTDFGVLVPYLRGEWRHEFENESDTIIANYAAQQTGASFNLNVDTDGPDRNFFDLGLGISAVFARNIQGFVDYRTVVGLKDTSSHLFTVGIRGAF